MRFNKKDIEDYWFQVDNLIYWFENKQTFLRDIKIGIKNLVKWFPVIWKDRYWDHTFLYEILRFKLTDMEKNIRHRGMHIRAKQDADKIKICMNLLDRLIEDEYITNSLKFHDRKWGQGDFIFTDIEGTDTSSLDIIRPGANTPEEKEEERKGFRRCSTHADYLQEQDLTMLFGIMKKHIRGWWD